MLRFALSLALMATFACGTAKAADTTTTESTETKATAPCATKHKSCHMKSKAHHKGAKKVEKTETKTEESSETAK